MKKIIALILALAMCFALCACEKVEKLKELERPELPRLPSETAEPIDPENPPVTEAKASLELAVEELTNYVTVSTKKTTKLFYDPEKGEKLILTFAYDTPRVGIDGRDEAAMKIAEFLGMLDETYYTGNDYGVGSSYGVDYLHMLAIDRYTYVAETGIKDNDPELISSRECNAARADNKVLSLLFNDYVYISAEEESHDYRAYSFDTETGERITKEMLGEKLGKALSKFAADNYFVDYAMDEDNWFFAAEGISIICAAESKSPMTYTVPYSEIFENLDERYIPAERKGNGRLDIMLQEDYEDGSIEILDLVNVSENGTGVIVNSVGTVYDVTVSTVAYNNSTGSFIPTATLWLCSYMQDSGLQLNVSIPEGMPELMISYSTADGERVGKLVTENGEDGGIVLVNTDITAVG